ncbi:hypothetical protein [Streptomyces sp. NPDC085540]|uniref:hypothetical protein n=1 Tax=Streptomyces sp. NPDC085540 TaxID=3365730 RepID=UPI0037D76492
MRHNRPSRSRPLAERVEAVLEEMDGSIDAHEVLATVNTDRGREVRLGSLRNALTALKS